MLFGRPIKPELKNGGIVAWRIDGRGTNLTVWALLGTYFEICKPKILQITQNWLLIPLSPGLQGLPILGQGLQGLKM